MVLVVWYVKDPSLNSSMFAENYLNPSIQNFVVHLVLAYYVVLVLGDVRLQEMSKNLVD